MLWYKKTAMAVDDKLISLMRPFFLKRNTFVLCLSKQKWYDSKMFAVHLPNFNEENVRENRNFKRKILEHFYQKVW